MNDIARPTLSTTDDAASRPRPTLTVQSPAQRVVDPPGTIDEPRVGVTWRRLDRFATAATLGMVLVSPQTALLMARMLGPRIPPSSAPPRSSRDAATRRQGLGR
jgi:hypothetical protein